MTSVFPGLLAIGALGFLILWREGVFRQKTPLFLSALLLLAAMALRGLCMEHETLDYQNFLARWVDYFRENGGFRALKHSVGNYNVPYLYFLALFSYAGMRDLYLIKLLSVLFDVLLAWAVLRIVSRFHAGAGAKMAAFFLTLFLPTVVLNGACWGQCDSIYAAFGLWSIAFALEHKPVRAVAAIALSFAFKLQAVFLLPVFLIFLLSKSLKWYHLPVFPLVYFLTVLPAVLLGRPLWDTVTLYFNQADSVGSGVNYNSPSMYAFVQSAENGAVLSAIGIAAAFVFLGLLYLLCALNRTRLNHHALLICSLLISVAVPFLLPHMHDRYFFLADVLSLALAVAIPRLFFLPIFVSFASLTGYYAYLTGTWMFRTPASLRYGACALLAVIAVLIAALLRSFSLNHQKRKRKTP